jgi:type III secretory pathway lipoprotein EscJ
MLPAGSYVALEQAAQQTSWWSSSAQEERRWQLGKQKMLAQMIEGIPEIESASVLIDRSPPRGLRSNADVRATVTVKPRGGSKLPPHIVRHIRTIVCGSVCDLAADKVAVVDLTGKTLLEFGASTAGADDLLDRMKEFEEHYTQKIRSVLGYIPDVLVTVNVELDTTRQRRTEQVVPAPEEEPIGPPNLEAMAPATVSANTAAELPSSVAAPPRAPKRPTQQQTWEEHVALAPKDVTVAIAVPEDATVRLISSTASSDPDADWSRRIKDQVAHAIPAGVATKISVESYPRDTGRTSAGVAGESQAYSEWLHWTAAAGIGVGVALMVALAGLRRHHSASVAVTHESLHAGPATLATNPQDAGTGPRRDLVRIEQRAASSRSVPHLGQVGISNFEDLRCLAPSSLQAVLAAVESRLWAPALRGASRELCERILSHMPTRAAALLRNEMEYRGPVRLGDVETAQHEILEVVRRLDHTGDLVLQDREEVIRV